MTFNELKYYFDAKLYDLESIDNFNLSKLKIIGGGGTNFKCIFNSLDNVKSKINSDIDFIIIITDGYAKFPKDDVRQNIPVLWIINNDKVNPPWGMVARI